MNYVFVSGLGRSGTRWLANTVNGVTADDVWGRHEPHFTIDHEAILSSLRGESLDEWLALRAAHCIRWAEAKGASAVVESNSNIRHGALKLAHVLRGKCFHLVRDPRDVICSFLIRSHYTPEAKGYAASIHPYLGQALDEWNHMSRFEKLCWLWLDAVEHMEGADLIRLEDLTNPDTTALEDFFDRAGIPCDRSQTAQWKTTKINESKHAPPKWADWSAEDKTYFAEHVGPVMGRFGYTL